MYILQDGQAYKPIAGEYANKEIMIAIDSSKTNSCMQIDDMLGRRLHDYEFRGEPKDEVLHQCQWERELLKTILQGARPKIVGIEDIITKKNKDGKFSNGIEIHQSRFKITAIFMSFICFFQDNFNITPELVNNWAWKSAILPEEYRTEGHKKGSLDWHKARHTALMGRTDDVTDCDCIMEFLKLQHGITGVEAIGSSKEVCEAKYNWRIISERSEFAGMRKFIDNPDMTVEDKIAYIVNRLEDNEMGYTLTDTRVFTASQLYERCVGKFNKKEERLALCIRRV